MALEPEDRAVWVLAVGEVARRIAAAEARLPLALTLVVVEVRPLGRCARRGRALARERLGCADVGVVVAALARRALALDGEVAPVEPVVGELLVAVCGEAVDRLQAPDGS